MKLTKNDFEWLDRIGVNKERMDIILENQEKLEKIEALTKRRHKGSQIISTIELKEILEGKLPQTRKVIKDGFDFRK